MLFRGPEQVKIKCEHSQTIDTRAHLELSDYLMKMADVLDEQVTIEDFTNEEAHKIPKQYKYSFTTFKHLKKLYIILS